MDITKEYLSMRLEQLNAQEEQALANLNAIHGAKVEVSDLIKKLTEEEGEANDGQS